MMNHGFRRRKFLLSLILVSSYGSIFVHPFALNLNPRGHLEASSTRLYVDGENVVSNGSPRHWVGDIIRSLEPRYVSQAIDAFKSNVKGMPNLSIDEDDLNAISKNLPDWKELAFQLHKQQSPDERRFRTDLEKGTGPPSALATKRLFGYDRPRVTLYRDRASWCPYCHKCLLALEELEVPYQVKFVDMRCYGNGTKPLDFTRIQPNGNLPCAVIDDSTVINESDDILTSLDELATNGKRLFPLESRDGKGREKQENMKRLCDDGRQSLERRLFSRWMWWLTGVRKPQEYRDTYIEHIDEVETVLAGTNGPFFLGKELSIVDVKFAPFLERQIASLAYFKGFNLRDADRWPSLVRWLQAMEERPSYKATKSDWYTHSRALPPQLAAGCVSEGGCEELQATIDEQPCGNEVTGDRVWIEPGWGQIGKNERLRFQREAAERLIHNHEAISRFAARGAGLSGLPAAAAPLSDPRAKPNDEAMPAIDVMLRIVSLELLSNCKAGQKEQAVVLVGKDKDTANAIADCLDYLRARIGVPRDMSHPAAQYLRANLLSLSSKVRCGEVISKQEISI